MHTDNNIINVNESLELVKQGEFAGDKVDLYKDCYGNVFMTIGQIAKSLEYASKSAVENILSRNKYLLDSEFSSTHSLRVDGKFRVTRLLSEDGIYEVTMLSKQPKAKEFRFFIRELLKGLRKGELQLNRASYQIDDPIERAKQWIKEEEERQQLGKQVLELSAKVETYEPKAEYLDTILSSKSTVNATQIANDYGLSAQALNRILSDAGIQYNTGGQWVLYSKHSGKGYTQSRTFERSGVTHMQTRWTQKGRLLIHDTLKQLGIIANMDKEETK